MGTGFVIHSDDDGSYVLTCNHVVTSVKEPKIDDFKIEIIAQHEIYDLALLYVRGLKNKKSFILKEISLLENQNKSVSLVGYRPFEGEEYRRNTRNATIFDKGMHKEKKFDFEVWEIIAEEDNYILRGYSGSPLMLDNQVIGVMTNKEQSNRGFATSIKYLADIWKTMPKGFILQESRENPFVGLSPFTQKTKEFFFGRDIEIEKILNRVKKSGFLAVIGDSGSGKSSIVKAGVIPLYLEKKFYVLELRPAKNPYIELSNQLQKNINMAENENLLFDLHAFCKHEKTTLLIYIDQFEELFTLTKKEARDAFLKTLLYLYSNNSDSRLKIDIIFTMRSDYFPQLQQYKQFYAFIMDDEKANQFLIKRMGDTQLKETIVKPLLKVKMVNEVEANSFADLVILNMGNKSNEVTLLQNALTLIWHSTKKGKTLIEAYKAVGGIGGALPTLANETIALIGGKNNKDIQAIFLRLLKYAKKGNHTRRIAEKSEFSSKQWALVQLLSSALNSVGEQAIRDDEKLGRLLKLSGKSNEQSIELIHETLITSWSTYSDWIQEFGSYKMTHDIVIEKTKDYVTHQEKKEFLLMGSDLLKVLALRNSLYKSFLSEKEVFFIQKSIKKQRLYKLFLTIGITIGIGLVGLLGVSKYLIEKGKEKAFLTLESSVNGALSVLNNQNNVEILFDKPIIMYKDFKDAKHSKVVAKALFGKAVYYQKKSKQNKSIDYYQKFLERVKDYSEDKEILEFIAQALYNKGYLLEHLTNKIVDSTTTYNELIRKFKDNKNENIAQFVCMGWFNKAKNIKNLNESEEELFKLINRYKDFNSSKIREKVAFSYAHIAWLKFLSKEYAESINFGKESQMYLINSPYVEINLAHAYLALGNKKESFSRYLKYKDNKGLKQEILKDFKNFKTNGLEIFYLEEIEKKMKEK